MNGNYLQRFAPRRLFLTRFGWAAGVVGATAATTIEAGAQTPQDTRWQATRHAQDDWYDKIPGQHRFVIDSTSADGIAMAMQFGGNYFTANQNDYGLQDKDLAVIIVARHKSTSFAFNDAMWAKYGKQFSEHASYTDPKTKEAATANPYLAGTNGQPGRIEGLVKRGVNFAVCKMATRNIAGIIARATGGDTDTIFTELGANLVTNGHLVPAGIVAVSRAQEHGYTLATT